MNAKFVLGVAFTLGMASMVVAAEGKPNRPNLILIVTDDQRWDAIGYANPFVHSPNLDRFASRGARFEQATIVLPVCSPSRAGILTGRYGMRNGVTTYHLPISDSEVTFAKYLRDAGYLTAMVGKWHVPGKDPTDFEFEEVRDLGNTRDFWQPLVANNGRNERASGTGHDYIVDEAIQIMKDAQTENRPFAIYLSSREPHNAVWRGGGQDRLSEATRTYYEENPLTDLPTPPNIPDDLTGKPPYLRTYRGRVQRVGAKGEKPMTPERFRENQYAIYAMVTELDRALGRLFTALDELGLAENTYVLVIGDNGLFDGEHGLMSKALHYEESARVPFFAVGPGIAPSFDEESLVTNLDLAPTLLDLAGLAIPGNMHGSSLKATLLDQVPLEREFVLLEHPEENATLEVKPFFSLRSKDWKLIQTHENGKDAPPTFEELYDLAKDPFEMTNLASMPDHAERVAQMRTELARQRDAVMAQP